MGILISAGIESSHWNAKQLQTSLNPGRFTGPDSAVSSALTISTIKGSRCNPAGIWENWNPINFLDKYREWWREEGKGLNTENTVGGLQWTRQRKAQRLHHYSRKIHCLPGAVGIALFKWADRRGSRFAEESQTQNGHRHPSLVPALLISNLLSRSAL